MSSAASATSALTTTSSSATRTSDCRKFSPNIFNKSKCSHCFRQREEHSAAALECNRASRKVSKCGYLFVAPDWDFSNPLYRTKRWQRRWFVLYDDGELTYSVDEHPETVPQACIDMTKVLEVTTAEDVTGHSNSIAITAPDRVTFVKGTCPEESKWWLNILIAFPKSKGRHKRNATFPGAQATTTILQSTNSDAAAVSATARNRHNSYHKDILTSTQSTGVLAATTVSSSTSSAATTAASMASKQDKKSSSSAIKTSSNSNNCSSKLWSHNDVVVTTKTANSKNAGGIKNNHNANVRNAAVNNDDGEVDDEDDDDVDDEEDDGVETGEDDECDEEEESGNSTGEECNTKKKSSMAGTSVHDENNRNAVNEIKTRVSPPCLLIEDIRRDEKTIKDLANTITNLSQQQKNRWTTTAVNNVLNTHLHQHSSSNNNNKMQQPQDDKNSRDETDFYRTTTKHTTSSSSLETQSHLRPKSLPLASSSTPAIVSAIVKKIPPVMVSSSSQANTTNNSSNRSKSSPRYQIQQQHQLQSNQNLNRRQKQALERGDPDGGCNLDDLSSNYLAKTVELRVNPSPPSANVTTPPTTNTAAVESLNAKKGWLMKQDNRTGDWTKHWFTLSGAALFYYRDPVSEERGVLDGVLDVNSLTNVAEVNANRNYALQLTTWDKRRLILASLSPNSRNSWIAILRNAAGLQQNPSVPIQNSNTNNNNSNNNNNNNNNNGQSNCSIMNHSSTLGTNESHNASNKSIPTTELIIKDNTSDDMKSEIEKDFIKAQRINNNSNSNKSVKKLTTETSPQVIITGVSSSSSAKSSLISPQTPITPKTPTHFSSDEEYRTASEGGRRDSIGDWGSPLSPSPPAPLNVMRTKDRMRPRTTTPCPRMHKRSRSSPPSSRRSTVDSVGSDELPIIHTVHEEINLNVDKELQFRLSVVEKERDMLRDEAKEREARMSELLNTLERTEQELNNRIHEMEEVRESLSTQLEDAKRNASQIIDRITDELQQSERKIKDLEDRLARGIEENESLYKRLREMESYSPASFINLQKSKMKRMDSLSDLTQINDIDPYSLERDSLAEEYSELKGRFEKAVNEIRAMKRELKESQNQYDSLEISYASLKQDLERKDIEDQAQLQMMAARIQDLTLKYSSSERQVRTLKQKLAKSERRRSLSLKGKEQLTVSKELEAKLGELEAKIDEIEKTHQLNTKPITENPQATRSTVKKSSRRRSLDASLSAAGISDSLQFLVRVNDLEKRCEGVNRSSSSTPTSHSATPSSDPPSRASSAGNLRMSEHLVERLKCLESVLITSKDRLEQSLSQLQNLKSSRNRRSVSPITERKDSYRFLERCLQEVVKLIRESTETCVLQGTQHDVPQPGVYMLPDSSPVKKALTQLESQLRSKLAELLKQRRMLRERNELTKRKDLELLAERIAFESVCFGKLRDSVDRAENPELFSERQTRAEVAETSHLMSMLKAKLQGKCAVKTSGSLDILAGVLARRLLLSSYQRNHGTQAQQVAKLTLEPVDQNMLDDLLRQQNEINVIAMRYKNKAMENLATSLAAETLSYMTTNDLVQGAVQEAWRQAQETVNAELVQSEIAHIMMRNAERLETSVTPSFGYTLTSEERLSFEKFADAVHDVLRREMEMAVNQLTQCYEETMQQMKRGQWRMHLQHEHKASEGRQLLSEFSDIIAHKALVDARIDVLRGDYATQSASKVDEEKQVKKLGITALQKYENLFEELSNDLQINNSDDILLEADFEFMYKQHAVDFLSDRQVLCDISTFLSQLEDSLIALQCEATASPNEHIPRTEISIESLQDVCHKCCELRKRADQLLQEVHRKLNASCQHCLQVREKLHSLQKQHESEILRLQQSHAKDLTALMQQIENQRTAIRCLEAEKNAINQDLNKSEELMEERERELKAVTQRLHAKEQTLQATHGEQRELLKRLEAEEEKVRSYQEESDALTMKCARQDDEYVMLLQERDYIQSQLAKEHERSRRLEKRLELLEMEHAKQMECLQQAYRDQMLAHSSELANVVDEESFRQRYQSEIEQLRTLCEKGLSAMESSHRRTLNDLEEKHKQEIERLLIEKETALAEETQATLAALDAMRKAHQSEVQREVARFKQEFLKQFQQRGERTLDSTKAKEEELDELRQEILSFSEKYSIKCVENAALEEKFRIANQKLKHFQQMQQLELRNKQFRAHLASDDPSKDIQFVSRPKDGHDDNGDAVCQDSEHVHAKKYNQVDNEAKIYKNEQLLKHQEEQQIQCKDNEQLQQQKRRQQQNQANQIEPLNKTSEMKTQAANDRDFYTDEHNNDIEVTRTLLANLSSLPPPPACYDESATTDTQTTAPRNITTATTSSTTNNSTISNTSISISNAGLTTPTIVNEREHNTNNNIHNTISNYKTNNTNKYNNINIANNNNINVVGNSSAAVAADNNENDTNVTLLNSNSSSCYKNSRASKPGSGSGNNTHLSKSRGGLDDDCLTNCRYSYEPCYKQTNLFNYQNRMLNFEGLKTATRTTFGKNLKSFKNQYKIHNTKNSSITTPPQPITISPTRTTTSTSSSSSSTTSKICKNEQYQQQKPEIFRSIKTFQIPDKKQTSPVTSSTIQSKNINLPQATKATTIKSLLNPVDLPKNFSANNQINLQLNSFYNTEKQLDNTNNPNHIYNNNNNNNRNNKNSTTTTNDRKNKHIAERCSAINLNSFTGIIQKASTAITTATATSTSTTLTTTKQVGDDDNNRQQEKSLREQQHQNNNDSTMCMETSATTSTVITNCNSYNISKQQQHHQQSHQPQQPSQHDPYQQDMDHTILKTKRSRISSPPPLDGRDVELKLNTTTTCTSGTNTNNINPIHNSTNSIRNTSSHIKRFELEI